MHDTIEIPVPGRPWSLEGRWTAGSETAVVVAPPHPLYGGNLDNPVVVALVDGFRAKGHGVLGFNWRGVGRSGGMRSGDFADAKADYAAAVEKLCEIEPRSFVAAGYSYGALAAAAIGLDDARVERLVLASPPASFLEQFPLATFDGPIRLISGDHDEFSPSSLLVALEQRCARLRITFVDGADHFFSTGGFDQLREFAARQADS